MQYMCAKDMKYGKRMKHMKCTCVLSEIHEEHVYETHEMQCVASCCSELQCVAVCCSVLQLHEIHEIHVYMCAKCMNCLIFSESYARPACKIHEMYFRISQKKYIMVCT